MKKHIRNIIIGCIYFIIIGNQSYLKAEDTLEGYKLIYQTNTSTWDNITKETPLRQDSITIAPDPCGSSKKVLKFDITTSDDYSKIGSGYARAEITLYKRCMFQPNKDYVVQWDCCFPTDFTFDTKQKDGLIRIHTGIKPAIPSLTGLFFLSIENEKYLVQVLNLKTGQYITESVGAASNDKGKWISWKLHYRLDSVGDQGLVELYKNGQLLFKSTNSPNAYPDDEKSHIKMGPHKWDWKTATLQGKPSDVTQKIIYYDNLRVFEKLTP